LLELDGEQGWLCYSASTWPRLADARWLATLVADHVVGLLAAGGEQ
jgi:hypothetical protein